MKKLILLSLSIMICFSYSLAFGNEKANYFIIKGGVFTPTNDLDNTGLDTAFTGEVGVGHYFNPNFAVEVGLGYYKTDTDEADLTILPITISAIGLFPSKKFEPYVKVGVGAYGADFDGTLKGVSVDDHDVILGIQLGLGTNVDITPSLFIGLEGDYIWTSEAQFSSLGTDLNGLGIKGTFGTRF